jgi:hypothetical protein
MQQESPAYRTNELLLKFRDGVSQKDKETIIAAHGGRSRKQLRGDSGFEKVQLVQSRDARTATLDFLLNPQVEFANQTS